MAAFGCATLPLTAAYVVALFKSIWQDSWGIRMEYILDGTVLSAIENLSAQIPLSGTPRPWALPCPEGDP
jgi:hypothetical protein